jgi:hypothetical protein
MRRGIAVLVAVGAVLALAGSATGRVLRVGSYHGIRGQYQSLQAAVKAAHAGDWILVGPGDYKTKPSAISHPKGFSKFPAGVLITKARLHIRGMDRNTVIVDGTKPGTKVCSPSGKAQNFGYRVAGKPSGLNGLMVWKARGVSIENLTACNFLGGSQVAGNQIWWNGGEAGRIGGYGFQGTYLSATSTYFKTEATAATYGIFSSNWSGGTWDQTYASNFNDSGYYIGACQQVCNQTMNHAHAQYNALGYSGSNAGGRLLIQNSEFDHNQDGFDTNSQNGDNPPPQNGACPAGVKPPVSGAPTCWVFTHNYVHDNNNPNVPSKGSAAAGPVGTGMSLSGARNDTVMNNRFVDNNAWGVILVSYPDHGGPCTGGTPNSLGAGSCLFDQWGNAILNNQFGSNGGFGHPSNGDIAAINLESGHPTDCYAGNTEIGGGSIRPASAAALQTTHPSCNGSPRPAESSDPSFLNEVLCDTRVSLGSGPPTCPTGPYPRATKIVMHPVPKQKTMKDPCAGVPSDPWCGKKKKKA